MTVEIPKEEAMGNKNYQGNIFIIWEKIIHLYDILMSTLLKTLLNVIKKRKKKKMVVVSNETLLFIIILFISLI